MFISHLYCFCDFSAHILCVVEGWDGSPFLADLLYGKGQKSVSLPSWSPALCLLCPLMVGVSWSFPLVSSHPSCLSGGARTSSSGSASTQPHDSDSKDKPAALSPQPGTSTWPHQKHLELCISRQCSFSYLLPTCSAAVPSIEPPAP